MTVRFTKAWNGFSEQQIVSTLSTAEEDRLIGLGFCYRYTDDGKLVSVKAKVGADKVIKNIVDSDGNDSFLRKIGFQQIRNAFKIEPMLAKIARGGSDRVNIPVHSMSLGFGVGSTGSLTYTGGGAGRTDSMFAVASRVLNAMVGGRFTPGFDAAINGVWSVTAPAAFSSAYASAGPEGRCITLSTGAAILSVVGGYAGQVVRILAYATPTSPLPANTPLKARYSMAGANNQAEIDAPASTGTDIRPDGVSHWYEFNITLAAAGNTTITIKNPTADGTIVVYGDDYDYRTDAGITFHRTSRSGNGITECCAWALDGTDTQPAGNWIGNTATEANRRSAQYQSMVNRLNAVGTILSFDINDPLRMLALGYSLDDHYRHVKNYIAPLNAAGLPSLIVCGNLRSPATVTGPYSQRDVIDVYRQVSDESNNYCGAGFIDLTENYPSGVLADQFAWQWRNANYITQSEDPPVHPNPLGTAMRGAYLGRSIANAMAEI